MEGSGLLEYLKKERNQEWRAELRSNFKTKERTQLERLDMPEQDPEQRNKNFTEVNLGLTEEQAIHEARRCIDCPNPTCITGCPVGINIAWANTITDWATWGVSDELREMYDQLPVKPSDCIECGDCVERCPFGVDVVPKMRHAVTLFE